MLILWMILFVVLSAATHVPRPVKQLAAATIVQQPTNPKVKDVDIVAAEKDTGSFLDLIPDGVKNGIASGLAAAVVKTVLQPLDTIKTVQQAQKLGLNPIAAIRKVVKRGGVGALWAGLGVTVLGSSPSVAIYFGAYSSCKKYFTNIMPDSAYLLAVAISASLGNTFASVLRVPYEVIKQRMQNGEYATTMEAISHCMKNDGMSGIFAGGKLYSQILRDVPYAIVTLVSYEILQTLVTKRHERQRPQGGKTVRKGSDGKNSNIKRDTKATDALCGAIAGGWGSFLTTPMDVVKTRMMTSTGGGSGSGYASVGECVRSIIEEEGLESFFIGTGPRLLHKVPANGLFFLCYEAFRSILQVQVKA